MDSLWHFFATRLYAHENEPVAVTALAALSLVEGQDLDLTVEVVWGLIILVAHSSGIRQLQTSPTRIRRAY
jgi:hypothetical protein